jgi:hypothetical protein
MSENNGIRFTVPEHRAAPPDLDPGHGHLTFKTPQSILYTVVGDFQNCKGNV